jgi:hypothetical protein
MLYQLIGNQFLRPGNLVDMGPGGERFGIIQSIVKENYQLPDKCAVTGSIRFINRPVHLFLIRGCSNSQNNPPAGYVWSFTS